MSESIAKAVFACDLADLITAHSNEEVKPIEALIKLGDGVAFNVRATYIKSTDEIRPNVWLHRILEDGTTSRLCFFPLVQSRWSKQYGGHNESWFKTTFATVWADLEAQMRERLRSDGSVEAGTGDVTTSVENPPF